MTPHQGTDPRPLPDEPLALDLLNTQWLPSGTPVDLLATPTGTRAWLAAAGAAVSPVPGTEEALAQARQAIRNVVSGQGGAAALNQLNAVLGHGRLRLSIGPPMNPRQTLEVDDPAWRPAVMAAANLLELLAQAPDRIRRCQNPACVLWFFDTTRNGTRRWCSMTTCGNRAKARRHYDRVRGQPSANSRAAPARSRPRPPGWQARPITQPPLQPRRTSREATQNNPFGAVRAAMPTDENGAHSGGSVRAAVQPIGNGLQQSCLTGLM